MKCPHCNKEHADTAKFCEETGNPLEPHFQYCKNDDCDFRSPLPLSAKFCPNCGNKLGGSFYVKFIARYVQTRDDNRCDLYSTDGDIIAEGLESIGISAFKNSDKYFFLKDNVLTALDPSYIHILDSFRGDGWNYSDLGQSSLYYIVSTSFGTGLMDRNFNSVIKVGKYDEIKHLWSWIIGVRNSNNWGILDLRKMSEPTLDYKKIQILHGYKEHYIVYRDYYDKYGLLSLDGTVLLHAQFDEIIDVVDEVERILIARNGDIGAINIDSKEVIIPFIFTEIDEISGTNGFAYQVSRTVQSGIYSVEGEELLPLTEDDLFTYCIDSKIKVEITDNNGECTEKRFLIPASFCEYDQNGLIIFDENDNGRRGYRRRRLIDKRGTIIFSDYCMDLYNQGNYYIVDYNDQPSKIINYNGKRVGIIPVGFHGARYCNGNIISFADRSNKTCIFNSDGELLYQIPDNVIVAESFNNDRLYYFDNKYLVKIN